MLLNAKTRALILSLPFAREFTNWYENSKNYIFFKRINKERRFEQRILSMKDTMRGKRCFIVGNGPSLTDEQLELIMRDYSFGANRIYKVFDKTAWRPDFYVLHDKYDLTTGIYENLKVDTFFVSDAYWKEHGMKNGNAICYHVMRQVKPTHDIPFSSEVHKYIQSGFTVTFIMIQFACYMGFSEIYLIGMDHKYANEVNEKNQIIKKNNVKSHVFEDEKPNEVTANICGMEDAYRIARNYCEQHDITIKNASIGGALEIFDRVDFFSLFGGV